VSSCRASRQRLAPNEVRTAISRWRMTPRATSRPLRLAQAISSITAAIPDRSLMSGRYSRRSMLVSPAASSETT